MSYDSMTVTVPEGELDGIRVERFTVSESDPGLMRLALEGRSVPPGTYTRLMKGERLWMSDTPAEKRDHMGAVIRLRQPETRRVLVNGLGLGMIVQAALACDHVEHIDVVEIDERVARLVGPHYTRDPRVHLHTADAYAQAKRWPPGTRWDVAWHDIWDEMGGDHAGGMIRLHRSYGRRVTWQDSWGRDHAMAVRRNERAEQARRREFFG